MIRAMKMAVVMTVVAMSAGEARAQYGYGYPGGYGSCGWGGWGSTPQGSMARGMGMFSMGRGMYNLGTSQARSINASTVTRMNQFMYLSQQNQLKKYVARQKKLAADNTKARGEIYDRLRNHPTQRDITDGDALNTLLDILLNPASADSSLQLIKTPLRSDVIRDIPFEYATEGLTVCLDRMTMDDQWPLAVRGAAFRPEREAVRSAISAVLEQDKEGDLDPDTIQTVQTAIDQLRAKFEKDVPQDNPDYVTAHWALKAMNGLTKMLYSPQMEKVLAELEDYQGTTLGDLLGFMQAFNLRFGSANSYRQKQIYVKLYPMLAEQAPPSSQGSAAGDVTAAATGAVDAVESEGTKVVDGLKSAAIDFFKDMKL
jgi:hypothetical protein